MTHVGSGATAESTAGRKLVVWEGHGPEAEATGTALLEMDRTVEAGREADIAVGVHIPNRAISRLACRVTARPTGWGLEVRNRNGAVVHPWGQAPHYAAAETEIRWPLVGIRLLHEKEFPQHWLLLTANDLTIDPPGTDPTFRESTATDRVGRPGDLPVGEREALSTTFAELLAWPPRHPAQPLQLKQAAHRLGLSVSGVQERLNASVRRAARLGNRTVPPTDPSYLFTLVRAGYIAPPIDE